MQTKEELRLSLKKKTKQFDTSSFILEDRASAVVLLESPAYRNCTTLFAFSPLPSEVDITVVLDDAIKGKKLALPRCRGDHLEFSFVGDGWKNTLKPSSLGVLEPLGGDVAVPDPLSLILVPAMAYTPSGARLGRGKGYYDRYLGQYPNAYCMGICRSYQLVRFIPTEGWDVRVRQVLCNGVMYES